MITVTRTNRYKLCKEVQVGNDQEKAQSEKDSHSKNRGGKKQTKNKVLIPRIHFVSRMSSYFPNRWSLSYLNLTRNMITYIRRQQHKKLSRLMGKPTICIGENKDADQLRGNREADQRLCFRYSDSTVPLLLKSEISSF